MTSLLFDENLSEAVLPGVTDLFPGSSHVRLLRLGGASDAIVWDTARERGAILVTRDFDFQAMSVLRGHPPKVIHIEAFNPSNQEVVSLLRRFATEIERFATDLDDSFLGLRLR